MGDLTTNFSRDEFICKCGCEFDDIDMRLVKGLQKIRDILNVPLMCVVKTERGYLPPGSGCRCESYNEKIGGVSNSKHISGIAADIWGMPSIDEFVNVAETIDVFKHGGIGVYKSRGFVHLDVRGYKARWTG